MKTIKILTFQIKNHISHFLGQKISYKPLNFNDDVYTLLADHYDYKNRAF